MWVLFMNDAHGQTRQVGMEWEYRGQQHRATFAPPWRTCAGPTQRQRRVQRKPVQEFETRVVEPRKRKWHAL